jgi:hypothetical protein
VSGGRTDETEVRAHVEPPVERGPPRRDPLPRPRLGASPDLHDRHAVGRHRDLLDRCGVVGARGEHQLLVRVLMVGDQQPTLCLGGVGQHADEVVVVAELLGGRLGRLVVHVERRGALDDSVTPADQDVCAEAARHGHPVVVVGRHRRELPGADAATGHRRRGERHAGGQPGGRQRPGRRTQLEDRTPGQRPLRHLTEGRVLGLVGDRLVAGVAAAVLAGQVAAGAVTRGEQGEQRALRGDGHGSSGSWVGGCTLATAGERPVTVR